MRLPVVNFIITSVCPFILGGECGRDGEEKGVVEGSGGTTKSQRSSGKVQEDCVQRSHWSSNFLNSKKNVFSDYIYNCYSVYCIHIHRYNGFTQVHV